MAPKEMTLKPSEFWGEAGTCVVGRAVMTRGPFKPERKAAGDDATPPPKGGGKGGKGKKGGKGGKGEKSRASQEVSQKSEVHFLGGTSLSEILYMDAWSDGAEQLIGAVKEGKVYRISGARKITSAPTYSTSRLDYYLRFIPPIGINTKIELYDVSPWCDLPLHHPFSTIANLPKVQHAGRYCLLGVVTYQPGLVSRDTRFGVGMVCNATLKQGDHDIRCGFWRDHGQALSQYAVGDPVALMQVTVYQGTHGWEVAATEATRVGPCPDSLREGLLNTTEVCAAGTSLTQVARVDYDAVKAIPATLSGLASVVQPRVVRDLTGVYEIHSVAVMGVSSVLENGSFSMMSCAACKAQVDPLSGKCHNPEHSSSDAEQRWILQMDIADNSGGAKAMLYHDAAETLPFLHGDGDDSPNKLRITRAFRSTPWSIRVIYKRDDRKQTNNLDLKRIVPTISVEGFVASFRLLPTPIVPRNDACPFAACKSVSYDKDLGALFVSNLHVQAVRLLIEVQPVPEDETIAEPDESQNGFRVTRRVKCEIDSEDSETYIVKAAGTSAHVQWLMTAQDNAVFLVTARKGGEDEAFNILSHLDTKTIGKSAFAQLMKKHMNHVGDVAVTHELTDTPLKRLVTLKDAVPLASTPRPFNKRLKMDELGSFS